MKTSTKRKAISKKVPALQTMSGMLLNAKLQNKEIKIPKELSKKAKELDKAIEDHIKYANKGYRGWDEPTSIEDIDQYYQNCGAEATVAQIKNAGKWLEEPKMFLTDKITWVLTVVNVGILGYLIIKNV